MFNPMGLYNRGSRTSALWSQAGLLLTFLALVTIALGIADVFFSYVEFCTKDDYATSCSPAGGSNYPDVLTFTWVSAGIWGGVFPFITGIFAMQLARNLGDEMKKQRWLYIAIFTALLALPAMIVVEALLAYYVTTEGGGFYVLNGSDNSAEVRTFFALPITIGVLGTLEFLIVGVLLLYHYSRNYGTFDGYGGDRAYKSDYEMTGYGSGPFVPIRPRRAADIFFRSPPPVHPVPPVLPPPPNGNGSQWPYPRPYLPQPSPYSRSAYYPSYGGGLGNGFGGF